MTLVRLPPMLIYKHVIAALQQRGSDESSNNGCLRVSDVSQT